MRARRAFLTLTALALSFGLVAVAPSSASSASLRPRVVSAPQLGGLRQLEAHERAATSNAFANPRVSGPCPCYFYNAMAQRATASGVAATLSQPLPRVGTRDYHSLTELVVESADQKQAIEFGWVVSKAVNHDSRSHLFVTYWRDGVITCFNTTTCPFVSTAKPGAPHKGGVVKVGKPATFSIQYKASSARWVLAYNGSALGYFPASLWQGRFKSVSKAQAFGEVDSRSTAAPHSQMGNGILGTKAGAATVTNFNFIGGKNFKPIQYYDADKPTGLYKIGARSPTSCTKNCFMHYGGPGA